MTTAALACLALALCLAAADWLAVARGAKRLEYFAKPVTMLALIAAAATLSPRSEPQRIAWMFALALGLAGDAFLMMPDNLFVPGLTAFLGGHGAYIYGFALRGVSFTVGALLALPFLVPGGVLLIGVVKGLRRRGSAGLIAPVGIYAGVITFMVGMAIASANPLAAFGALLFYFSDNLIAQQRFVRQIPYGRLAIMVTYYLGQGLLLLSLL
jgi:uncharacterized membrane protein YhhN